VRLQAEAAVPHRRACLLAPDPDAPRSEHTDWTLELALPLLERAARSPVEGLTGQQDAFDAISTLPRRISRWLRRELPSRAVVIAMRRLATAPRAV
jgi:hypothetical protein